MFNWFIEGPLYRERSGKRMHRIGCYVTYGSFMWPSYSQARFYWEQEE